MRDAEQTGANSVLGEQQPAGKTLFNIMQPITPGCLSDLQSVNCRIAIQPELQSGTRSQHGLQRTDADLKAIASDLHHCAMRAPAQAGSDWDGCKAFVSRHPDLDAFPASSCEDQRDHACIQEVGVFEFSVGFVKAATLWQANELQVRPNQIKLIVRNGEKDGVAHRLPVWIGPFAGLQRLMVPFGCKSFVHSILRVLPNSFFD